jgi:hypothetical protein
MKITCATCERFDLYLEATPRGQRGRAGLCYGNPPHFDADGDPVRPEVCERDPACHLYQDADAEISIEAAPEDPGDVLGQAVDGLIEDVRKLGLRVVACEAEHGIRPGGDLPCPNGWRAGHPACERCEFTGPDGPSEAERCRLRAEEWCAICGQSSTCSRAGVGLCCACCREAVAPYPDDRGAAALRGVLLGILDCGRGVLSCPALQPGGDLPPGEGR